MELTNKLPFDIRYYLFHNFVCKECELNKIRRFFKKKYNYCGYISKYFKTYYYNSNATLVEKTLARFPEVVEVAVKEWAPQ